MGLHIKNQAPGRASQGFTLTMGVFLAALGAAVLHNVDGSNFVVVTLTAGKSVSFGAAIPFTPCQCSIGDFAKLFHCSVVVDAALQQECLDSLLLMSWMQLCDIIAQTDAALHLHGLERFYQVCSCPHGLHSNHLLGLCRCSSPAFIEIGCLSPVALSILPAVAFASQLSFGEKRGHDNTCNSGPVGIGCDHSTISINLVDTKVMRSGAQTLNVRHIQHVMLVACFVVPPGLQTAFKASLLLQQ